MTYRPANNILAAAAKCRDALADITQIIDHHADLTDSRPNIVHLVGRLAVAGPSIELIRLYDDAQICARTNAERAAIRLLFARRLGIADYTPDSPETNEPPPADV